MKTTIGIINYNLPHHIYYLVKSLKKQCGADIDIRIFDISNSRPIYSKADEVTLYSNFKEQYFQTKLHSLDAYKQAFEYIVDNCQSDWLIMVDARTIVKTDIIKYIPSDDVLMSSDIINDVVNPTLVYFNLKKLREQNINMTDLSTNELYENIRTQVGSKFKKFAYINQYISTYNGDSINLDIDKFYNWLVTHEHYWKSDYYDVIVSLTTFKGRIHDNTTYNVLVSLLNQQTRFKYKIALVLSREEFGTSVKLPTYIERFITTYKNKFEIIWTDKDTKPLKKLDPTMEKYPNLPIITLDDDDLCDNKIVEHVMTEHLKDPYYVLGTWMENTPNFVKWVAGVRLFPPHSLYNFPIQDYYTYYDGILDDNWNAMRCAYKMTPVKEISTEHNSKTNQTDLKLTREYLNTPWGEYYKRFIIAHLDEIPEELYYE